MWWHPFHAAQNPRGRPLKKAQNLVSWKIYFSATLLFVAMGSVGLVYFALNSEPNQPHITELLLSIGASLLALTFGSAVLSRFGKIAALQADRLAEFENASRESQQKLQLAIQSVAIGIWEWDASRNLMNWDDRMFELFDDPTGQPPTDLSDWVERIHAVDRSAFIRSLKESASTGLLSMRLRIETREGRIRHLRLLSRWAYDNDSKPIRLNGITWDITDDVVAHEIIENQRVKLMVSARLASLGEMAGGIAHEVNNPLQVIIGHSSLMMTRLERGVVDKDEVLKAFEKITSTADRIARIVKGLKTVARDGENDDFEETDPQAVFDDALALCTEKIKNHAISLDIDLSPLDGITIPCRSVQISQVLLNLLTNAYQAVEIVDEKWIKIDASATENWIEISIVDSGLGIAKDIRDRIFQPFFTTKDVGVGTGLGLSLSLSIARDHGGSLELDPESPHTRFVLRLPRNPATIQKIAS